MMVVGGVVGATEEGGVIGDVGVGSERTSAGGARLSDGRSCSVRRAISASSEDIRVKVLQGRVG